MSSKPPSLEPEAAPLDRVEEAGEESFPASDPPAETVVVGAIPAPLPAGSTIPEIDDD